MGFLTRNKYLMFVISDKVLMFRISVVSMILSSLNINVLRYQTVNNLVLSLDLLLYSILRLPYRDISLLGLLDFRRELRSPVGRAGLSIRRVGSSFTRVVREFVLVTFARAQ